MGGISVLIGMGLLMAIITVFIFGGIFLIISYIFESIAIFNFRKNCTSRNNVISFIPCYNKYLYGKIGNSKIIGIILCVISIAKIPSFILWFFYSNDAAFWLFMLFTINNFILNIIISSKIYNNYSKYDVLFTILSIVSFGVLRPVFLFAVRKNKKIEL